MSKSTAEIRQMFLDFFHSKGHQVVASSSLVPENDQTLLFTNAGMNQFKDVFLGLEKRPYSRASTAQRCVRAGGKHNDLENVGYTARHHTFFEMLGNFSFGDYFKQEAIHYSWELLTCPQWFSLDKERLWVTVYYNDDEAYNIWHDQIGVPAERIVRIGDKGSKPFNSDNFWQMGETGPCGPCTEIFFDHGAHIDGGPPGSPDEDGDRYIEIWNIVFMQFNRQADGEMQLLPHPSVDTGMGLERIAAVLQHVNSNYEIDLFQTLIREVASITKTRSLASQSLRVIADHIRSCAFLIADSVLPSNENRGYVLRRIIRRACRHGNKLGMQEPFFYKLVAPLIKVMASAGTILRDQQARIEQVLKTEEEQFARTLERGLAILDEELARLSGNTLSGEVAFRLYDTYGFPLDLTADVCRERNLNVDEQGFEQAMEQQRNRAKESSGFNMDYNAVLRVDENSEFKGYEELALNAQVSALLVEGKPVNEICSGQQAIVILDKTPFYAESGGQVGDQGLLSADGVCFTVNDTQKYNQAIGHVGVLSSGRLQTGDRLQAKVDTGRRDRIRLNHSATHLAHAALRQIVGQHVSQKGSLVNEKGLRFDFSHHEAVTATQLREIETLVNAQIRRNLPVHTDIMDLQAAKERGAMALFGEKYGEKVRVLSMGDFSIELCGGTHVNRTGDIGLFRIVSESGIASGVRRLEALTGEAAIEAMYGDGDQLRDIAHQLKTDNSHLAEKIAATLQRMRQMEKALQQLQQQQAVAESHQLVAKAQDIQGIKLLVSQLQSVEPKILRVMVDDLKQQLGSAVIVLATVVDSKIALICGVSATVTQQIKASDLVAMLAAQVGGKGGGRADMAQAGGVDVQALPVALASVQGWVASKLSAG